MDFDSMLKFSKTFSLIWFFLIFLAVVIWAYWTSRKKELEDMASIPMNDNDEEEIKEPEQNAPQ